MTYTRYYRIADFPIAVTLPQAQDCDQLFASAVGFTTEEVDQPILHVWATGITTPCDIEAGILISEDTNDMGRVLVYRHGDRFQVTLQYLHSRRQHRLLFSEDFSRAEADIAWDDVAIRESFSSLIRIAYSAAILRHEAISIHASAVCREQEAILFLGKSGTGKSTHARLWLQYATTTTLLNDDNPILRLYDGRVMAYGSPWSGKTPCYKQEGYPVRGIVRLRQAPTTAFRRLNDIEAFIALLPSCSMIRSDEAGEEDGYALLSHITQQVIVGDLACRPDEEAYRYCASGLEL